MSLESCAPDWMIGVGLARGAERMKMSIIRTRPNTEITGRRVCALARSGQQVGRLPCELVEEHVFLKPEDHNGNLYYVNETKHHYREVGLQFGRTGDLPLNPDKITFLIITGDGVDLFDHVEGSGDQLKCELHRFLPERRQVWAGPGAREDDVWFTCTLRHDNGRFLLKSFLRHRPTMHPATPPAKEDRHNWPPIGDRDTLITTAVMKVWTQSPDVSVGLGVNPRLDCHYSVDHLRPELSLEWWLQKRGERSVLFSYTKRDTQGSGVDLNALARRQDASLSLPLTRLASLGTYMCTVSIGPLHTSLDIPLTISEPPRVSLNVGSMISLEEGTEKKVVCEASGYYPLDVHMEWTKEIGRVDIPLNVLFSSHRHHQNGTYSLSAFFLLQANLLDSGSQYVCRVSHDSLRMPVLKRFILYVTVHKRFSFANTEEGSWWPMLSLSFMMLVVVAAFCVWWMRRKRRMRLY